MMQRLLRVFLLLLLSTSFLQTSLANAKNLANQPINAQKIHFSDPVIGRKIAISFHHAVLESNIKQGYIIADLTQDEKTRLEKDGFKITQATEWQKRYQIFQKDLQSLLNSKSQLAGIPGFPCYTTVEETFAEAIALTEEYPQLAEWIDIGDSWLKQAGQGGYDLMVLKITNKTISGDKPKLLINTGLHAREYTPVALALDFAKRLLNQYETNADLHWIVDHHEIHLLLQTNPDGRKIAEAGVYQRKNVNQNHCPSSTVGVDLNRNFAHFWNVTGGVGSSGNQCSSTYRGPSAESEPETQALSNYARSIFPDVRGDGEQDPADEESSGIHLDIHSYSELVIWPYGHTETLSPNDAAFVTLGKKIAWYNNYEPIQGVGLYPTDGTSDDVTYGELGIAAFTFELGTDFFQQCSVYENNIKENNLNALIYTAKATAKPYQLGFGPEVSDIKLNQGSNNLTIAPGATIQLEATASAAQTKKNTSGESISRIEYSIDTPIWQESATRIELSENDGDLSAVETMRATISTSDLALGRHTLYLQAYNQNGQVGVPSARFFTLSENTNTMPTASFTIQCNELECSFDASASSDADGQITQYNWLFTEDQSQTTAEGANASHEFATAGDKTVTLTVTDDLGAQAEQTQQISVTVSTPEPEPEPETSNSSSGSGALFALNGLLLMLIARIRGKKFSN